MLNSSITPEFIERTEKLGVTGIYNLLTLLPKKYHDFRNPIVNIHDHIETNEKIFMKVKVVSKPVISYPKRGDKKPGSVKLSFKFGSNYISSTVFGGVFDWKDVAADSYIFVTGKLVMFNNYVQLKGTELIPVRKQNRIVPEYKSIPKILTSASIEDNIAVCLRDHIKENALFLARKIKKPKETIEAEALINFKTLEDLFMALHRPISAKDVENAMVDARRLNAYSSIVEAMSSGETVVDEESVIKYSIDDIKKLLAMLPFELTKDQRRTIWDVSKDLNSPYTMDRLVSGDVGCGKTFAYAIPAVLTSLAKRNAVIMMPNLLLAKQVSDEIKEYFPVCDVELIIGGAKKTLQNMSQNNPIIVGTSAILWWYDKYKDDFDIDLLIIDEQQKLGQEQKNKLISSKTNFLEATATAIPKTMATVLYGNKTVSYIEECPVKKDISTVLVGNDQKAKVFEELKGIVSAGYQVAVLYPIRKYENEYFNLILPENSDIDPDAIKADIRAEKGKKFKKIKALEDGSDDYFVEKGLAYEFYVDKKHVEQCINKMAKYEELGVTIISDVTDPSLKDALKKNVEDAWRNWDKIYPGRAVMVHGGMSIEEKMKSIQTAKDGLCDAIITSSVIEIGLTMPDLRGLLIIDSDKYGASTLHQFRGRLARKGGWGKFFLMVDSAIKDMKEESRDRLNLLVKYSKGSLIAEDDMRQRGFGELNKKGSSQKGFKKGIFIGLKTTPQDVDFFIKKDKSLLDKLKKSA
jgi:RecG-like helicase